MPQISNFIKIRPVGAELFLADRWIHRHEDTIISFLQFFDGSKNQVLDL